MLYLYWLARGWGWQQKRGHLHNILVSLCYMAKGLFSFGDFFASFSYMSELPKLSYKKTT
jgi:hypothetical protein